MVRRLSLIVLALMVFPTYPALMSSLSAQDVRREIQPFLTQHCADCHTNGSEEGGFDLGKLGDNLADEATFAKWERLFDRVRTGEMPPKDADQPSKIDQDKFLRSLSPALTVAHEKTKGTVLRRLNRREYQNTMNDLFGTNVDLEKMLPEDGRSGEFDNVGDSLGLSLVHLQKYMDGATQVLDTAISKTSDKPETKTLVASYKGERKETSSSALAGNSFPMEPSCVLIVVVIPPG